RYAVERIEAVGRDLADAMNEIFRPEGAIGLLSARVERAVANGELVLEQLHTMSMRQDVTDRRLAEGSRRFDDHDRRLQALEADKAECERRHSAIEAEIAALRAGSG